MPLSVDQLEVASFETTAPEVSYVTQPDTHDPLCYSPFCGPTMVQPQCPETTQPATA